VLDLLDFGDRELFGFGASASLARTLFVMDLGSSYSGFEGYYPGITAGHKPIRFEERLR
jgi:hypothetical protein